MGYLYHLSNLKINVLSAIHPMVSLDNSKTHKTIQLLMEKLKNIKRNNNHPRIHTYWASQY